MKILNIGSGKNYRKDATNVDINPMWNPDIVGDICSLTLDGEYDLIIAHDVLEHIQDIGKAMTNCLGWLKDGGKMDIIVPYDLSYGAWQDPTHIRAFNEKSWLYYTDWFWYMGWSNYRFVTEELNFGLSEYGDALRARGVPDGELPKIPRAVDFMKVLLKKIAVTGEEKKIADHHISR